MGLGGHLTWTAAIREVHKKYSVGVFPCDMQGNHINSEIFKNNPYCVDVSSSDVFSLPLDLPETNYCLEDYPDRCVQRADKHIIEQICEYYGIENPELKCELYFTEEEIEFSESLLSEVSSDFLVIEPMSKDGYTVNKKYSFDKWQRIVDTLSRDIEIVQVGVDETHVLNNVTSIVGKTNFRQAACIIGYSDLLMGIEGGLIHAATAVDTRAISVISGFLDPRMVSYPQNENIYIGNHGPCGLKIACDECQKDVREHEESEIVNSAFSILGEVL